MKLSISGWISIRNLPMWMFIQIHISCTLRVYEEIFFIKYFFITIYKYMYIYKEFVLLNNNYKRKFVEKSTNSQTNCTIWPDQRFIHVYICYISVVKTQVYIEVVWYFDIIAYCFVQYYHSSFHLNMTLHILLCVYEWFFCCVYSGFFHATISLCATESTFTYVLCIRWRIHMFQPAQKPVVLCI